MCAECEKSDTHLWLCTQVMVYYGTERKNLTKAAMLGYDIILTTYPVIEQEHRKILDKHKASDTHPTPI